MQSINRLFRYAFVVSFALFIASTAHAGWWFIELPLAEGRTFKSNDFEDRLTSNGFNKASDFAATTSSNLRLGYQSDGGFRISGRGSWISPISQTTSTRFVSLDIRRGAFHFAYDFAPGGRHHLIPGIGFGGSWYRYTIVGTNDVGVAEELGAECFPSVAYEFGGKSVRLALEFSYVVSSRDEFKSYGTTNVSHLASKNYLQSDLGIIIGF